MARAVVAAAALAAVLVSVLAPAATAQMDSCSGELPFVLVGNYSGLACQPVWNNFVLRVCRHCSASDGRWCSIYLLGLEIGRDLAVECRLLEILFKLLSIHLGAAMASFYLRY